MNIVDENGNIVPNQQSKRVVSGILGIFFGGLGIHKFVLGYNVEGAILLGVSIITCGIGAGLTALVGLIEGIIYLTKSDEEFVYTYQTNKRGWF